MPSRHATESVLREELERGRPIERTTLLVRQTLVKVEGTCCESQLVPDIWTRRLQAYRTTTSLTERSCDMSFVQCLSHDKCAQPVFSGCDLKDLQNIQLTLYDFIQSFLTHAIVRDPPVGHEC